MKVLDQNKDGVTIHLSNGELRLIASVLTEVQGGPKAFDDEDWGMLIGLPRDSAERLIDEMQPALERANELEG